MAEHFKSAIAAFQMRKRARGDCRFAASGAARRAMNAYNVRPPSGQFTCAKRRRARDRAIRDLRNLPPCRLAMRAISQLRKVRVELTPERRTVQDLFVRFTPVRSRASVRIRLVAQTSGSARYTCSARTSAAKRCGSVISESDSWRSAPQIDAAAAHRPCRSRTPARARRPTRLGRPCPPGRGC